MDRTAPTTTRKIIHIDMDAFYASVEQRDNPELRGEPVIVGGAPDKRGVVAAASYEVRRFGVHSAMATSKALRLCPDAIIVKPRHSYYSKVSRKIMAIYREYTDLIEPLSLDECFLDVTENKKKIPHATTIAKELKKRIKNELNLTASAGVAPNKFLAKIASDMDKPDGLTVVKPNMVQDFLRELPVEKIWGVGRVTAKRMHEMGIRTIGQLAELPLETLQSQFGKVGPHYYRLARGDDQRPVQPNLQRKQISQETTFAEDSSDISHLIGVLGRHAEKVVATLRKKNLKGSTVVLKLRYDDFTTITRSCTLPFPTDRLDKIIEEGRQLLEKTEAGVRPVRLIGIGMSNLAKTDHIRQLLLFDPHGILNI